MGKMQIPAACITNNTWEWGQNPAKTIAGVSVPTLAYGSSNSFSRQLDNSGVVTGLHLYSGTQPDQTQVDAITTSVASLSELPRYSDLLVVFNVARNPVYGRTLPILLKSGDAILSGVASWFMLYTAGPNTQPAYAMVGSVGLAGSDADMIVETVDIVAGCSYKLPVFNFNFPTSFSW